MAKKKLEHLYGSDGVEKKLLDELEEEFEIQKRDFCRDSDKSWFEVNGLKEDQAKGHYDDFLMISK